ncbi:MAG: D-alanine--D-alanine ligase [Gammaproteobacteria bacterium]
MTDVAAFGKVAVMMGGDSNERTVSLSSGQAVLKALQSSGVNAHAFDPQDKPLSALKDEQFDRVFNVMHGKMGEDGLLQGTLSMMGIPFTGSNMLASGIGMDKVRSKWIWQAIGLNVIPGAVIESNQPIDQTLIERITLAHGEQLMVKPSTEGSSLGMTLCRSADELIPALQKAHAYSDQAIVERLMSGPEYTVAIIGNRCLPSIRIEPEHVFYDYSAKYEVGSGTQYFCPSGLSEEDEQQLQQVSLKAFIAVGCSGWGRVDFMADEQTGEMHLMELNTVPGMTETSLVPKAAAAAGISFSELCLSILETSMPTNVEVTNG